MCDFLSLLPMNVTGWCHFLVLWGWEKFSSPSIISTMVSPKCNSKENPKWHPHSLPPAPYRYPLWLAPTKPFCSPQQVQIIYKRLTGGRGNLCTIFNRMDLTGFSNYSPPPSSNSRQHLSGEGGDSFQFVSSKPCSHIKQRREGNV